MNLPVQANFFALLRILLAQNKIKAIYSIGFTLVVCLMPGLAGATHIVGGEMALIRDVQRTNGYILSINLYFDAVNGNAEVDDLTITAYIMRKKDNVLMEKVKLDRRSTEPVLYSQPSCATATLKTTLIQYTTPLTLNPAQYNEPEGYYVVWERCCRNKAITNIVNPDKSGSVFYLEFPSLQQGRSIFQNSSPQFRKLKGDYICLKEPFAMDFSATDADGDELRYSLVTPLIGNSSVLNPIPGPSITGTYPEAVWSAGMNLTNVIPGSPSLAVQAQTGMLTVTAEKTGLYAFTVLCEEYRNHVRIGAVRRDFQLMVLDCPINKVPALAVREPIHKTFYNPGDTLVASEQTQQNCLDILVTDPDPLSQVTLSLEALNFDPGLMHLTPHAGSLHGKEDTLRAKLCWESCLESDDGKPLRFLLKVTDGGCPVGKEAKVPITMLFVPLPNVSPEVGLDTVLVANTTRLMYGDHLAFQVVGYDPDQDSISLKAIGRGFSLETARMHFVESVGKGEISSLFKWEPVCIGGGEAEEYVVDFIVTDLHCKHPLSDTITVYLSVSAAANESPEISTSREQGSKPHWIYYIINSDAAGISEPITFDVFAVDVDVDQLSLRAKGRGYSMEEQGMRFQAQTGLGSVTSTFSWTPVCQSLKGQDNASYWIDFIVEDNGCPQKADSVSVEIQLQDTPRADRFWAPNVFTPNGDQYNAFFEIPQLPANTCTSQFKRLDIFNRWGRLVYSTSARDFQWDGKGFPTGVYFYAIHYTNRSYKGTVSILF